MCMAVVVLLVKDHMCMAVVVLLVKVSHVYGCCCFTYEGITCLWLLLFYI